MTAAADPTAGNRVFLSCVSDDFEKPAARFPGLRSALRKHLVAADCEVKVQEEFRQEGRALTVAKLDGYIRGCAAVIHLVGPRPGAVADAASVAEFLGADPRFLEKFPDLRARLGDCSGLTFTQWEAFLHRARLFRDRSALARARDLVEQHGYLRRNEELADVAAAARCWATAG